MSQIHADASLPCIPLPGEETAPEKTFQYDDKLPHLPVPSLEATLQGLTSSCLANPIFSSEQIAEFERKKKEAKDHLQKAQEVLQLRYKENNNYVGTWWDEFAYLRSRDPIVINTNVFSLRTHDFENGTPKAFISDPVERAALLSLECLEFRRLLHEQELPVGKMLGKPLCMNQLTRYFCSRQPGKGCDKLVINDPKDITEIHFMYRGQSFFVKAIENQKLATFAEIVAAIRLGMSKITKVNKDECVGILTAGNREKWAECWDILCQIDPENKKHLKRITKTGCTIAIDEQPIETIDQGIARAAHGNIYNRWFDRAILKMVASNGIVTENGDHTPMDAIVLASVGTEVQGDWGMKYAKQEGNLARDNVRDNFNPQTLVENTSWVLNDDIRTAIKEIVESHEKVASTCQIGVLSYKKLGRTALKQAKLSADGFFQQIIQLSYAQDRKRTAAVYESASTRFFKEGRTDVIRSRTPQQMALVQAMANKNVSPTEKMKAFGDAMGAHLALTKLASSGQGVDRHLMCLKIAQQCVVQEPLPDLFSDPVYLEGQKYELLTSQMMGNCFVGGFGHVLPDGYGVCYYLRPNEITAVVSGNASAGLTNVPRFIKTIEGVLDNAVKLLSSSMKK